VKNSLNLNEQATEEFGANYLREIVKKKIVFSKNNRNKNNTNKRKNNTKIIEIC
jgi:hypothetical protein